MRLDQFSCSNHDVGSSAMTATLCIQKKAAIKEYSPSKIIMAQKYVAQVKKEIRKA